MIVIAHADPGVPNWLDASGHEEGASPSAGSGAMRPPGLRWNVSRWTGWMRRWGIAGGSMPPAAPPSSPNAAAACSGASAKTDVFLDWSCSGIHRSWDGLVVASVMTVQR